MGNSRITLPQKIAFNIQQKFPLSNTRSSYIIIKPNQKDDKKGKKAFGLFLEQ